ncbi:MAG: FGGY-family carbohydrate kinase, partial [Gemmataceae bacterium]
VLWSLAYGVQSLREQASPVEQVMLTGGAAQSPAVRAIAADVFGVPVLTTDPYESVAVGAARQAAWALTGFLPEWSSPVSGRSEVRASARGAVTAEELDDRYRTVLAEVQDRA